MSRTAMPYRDRPAGSAEGSGRYATGPMIVAGGIAWVLATLQYAAAQLVTASGWSPPYDWFGNYISDLGNTACGMFAVAHAPPAYTAGPRQHTDLTP